MTRIGPRCARRSSRTKSSRRSSRSIATWAGAGSAVSMRASPTTSATRTYRPTLSCLTLTDAAAQGVPFQAIPTGALRAPVTIDVAGIHQSVLSWNVPSIMGLYTVTPKDPWLAQTNKFQVHEKVTTGFREAQHRRDVGLDAGARQSGRSVRPHEAEFRRLRLERWWLRRTGRRCRAASQRGCHL